MKKTFLIQVICLSVFVINSTAQNVGIGTGTPKASAVLDITSASKGVLFPRLTTVQRNAILNPANGLHIFNTNTSSLEYYDSTFNVWTAYCCNCDIYTDTILSNATAYVVPSGYGKVRLVINNLVKVAGTNVAPAISLVNIPHGGSVIIENFGGIYGKGGDGGNGGGAASSNMFSSCLASPAQAGKPGTDAIHSATAGKTIQLTIYNYGIIAGGGGGGGGGNFGTAGWSAGGGGGGGQGATSLGGTVVNPHPSYEGSPLPQWVCINTNVSDATNGGPGSFTSRGDFGLGSTGTGGGNRGGYGGTLAVQGQAGFGGGAAGGSGGKAIRFNNGHNSIINIGAGVVYGVVD